MGEFAYRQRCLFGTPLLATMAEELHGAGDSWPRLAAGLFGNAAVRGKAERVTTTLGPLAEQRRVVQVCLDQLVDEGRARSTPALKRCSRRQLPALRTPGASARR